MSAWNLSRATATRVPGSLWACRREAAAAADPA